MRGKLIVLSLAVCLLLSSCSNKVNTLRIMHANINCSNFEESLSFYEMLGFVSPMDTDVTVSAEDAAGLNMPPYVLHASTMIHNDGSLIDLIKWIDPYDPAEPYTLINHLGLSRISLNTTNLDADMDTLQAQGVSFLSDEPVIIDRPVAGSQLICFRDPDGTLIELVQLGGAVIGDPNAGGTYITGTLRTNVNCSDLEASRSFYEMLGFKTQEEVEEVGTQELADAVGLSSYHVRASTMALPGGHSLNLTKWEDPYDSETPYEKVNHIGIARFAIQTLSLDSDIALLEAQDPPVEFYSEPVRPDGVFGFLRFVCFEDPDGTIIELVQLF